jgi:alkylation response protein AidB-like acyl-CoA dehydrogenase
MANINTVLAENEKLSHQMLSTNADHIDQSRRFPRENLQALGKAGVLGLLIAPEYGGAGGGLSEMSQVLDAQARNCASTAMVTLMQYCATAVIAANGSSCRPTPVAKEFPHSLSAKPDRVATSTCRSARCANPAVEKR